MEDDKDILTGLLTNPDRKADPEWVERMSELYPAFFMPALLLLKRGGDNVADRQRLQTSVALRCPDPLALTDYIDPTGGGWSGFYPAAQSRQTTTAQAIDNFIELYGKPSTPEEDEVLERILFNPAPADYFAGIEDPYDPADPLALPPELRHTSADRQEESQSAAEDRRTDTPTPHAEEERPGKGHDTGQAATTQTDTDTPRKNTRENAQTAGEDSPLMESLAKIYIKQGRFERAYEIISKLSLKNSEKSVYFADQMRFLRKLIINQQYSNRNTNNK